MNKSANSPMEGSRINVDASPSDSAGQRVIFLDIDGVLNNRGCYRPGNRTPFGVNPDPISVLVLNHIIKEARAAVVVSSTWRLSGLDHMRTVLSAWGVEGKVLDITPKLHTSKGDITISAPRGSEISAWLARNPDVESYVILDDDDDMQPLPKTRLVQTTFESGLTTVEGCRAIQLLKEPTCLKKPY